MKRRIENPEAMRKAVERDGVCLYGLIVRDDCSAGLDPHHIVFKGAGGDDSLDLRPDTPVLRFASIPSGFASRDVPATTRRRLAKSRARPFGEF